MHYFCIIINVVITFSIIMTTRSLIVIKTLHNSWDFATFKLDIREG